MKITPILSRLFLPVLRCILTPLPGLRLLIVKLCILLEDRKDYEVSLLWLFEAHSFLEEQIDYQAIALGKGVHIKHEVMDGIHSFFSERIPSGATILDVGCGIGALANFIAKNIKDSEVFGIDLNSDHIRFARKRFKQTNLHYFVGDATCSLPSEAIDTIIMSSVLEHVNDRVGLLKSLQEVYQPIRLLIRVPTCERHHHAAMKRSLGIFSYADNDHKTEYTMGQFYEEMKNAELAVVSSEIRWGDIWAECQPVTGF